MLKRKIADKFYFKESCVLKLHTNYFFQKAAVDFIPTWNKKTKNVLTRCV